MPTSRASDLKRGILLLVFSAFGFACMNFFVRFAGAMPFYEKILFRNLIALVVSIIAIVKRRDPWPKEKSTWFELFLRAAFGTVGMFCNFYALDHMPIADASMLNKMTPFVVPLFSTWFLGERISLKQYSIIILAFLGALLVIKPTGRGDLFPYLVGILGGIASGAAMTCVRALGRRNVPGPQIVFTFTLFTTLVILPPFLRTAVPLEPVQVVALLMVGVCASVGQLAVTAAYHYAPAKDISIYDYSSVLFTAIIGMLFLGQVPDIWSVLGYLVVFAMAFWMFQETRRRQA